MPLTKAQRSSLENYFDTLTRTSDLLGSVLRGKSFMILPKKSQKDIYEVIDNSLEDIATQSPNMSAIIKMLVKESQ
jgi:hypothetical protein